MVRHDEECQNKDDSTMLKYPKVRQINNTFLILNTKYTYSMLIERNTLQEILG